MMDGHRDQTLCEAVNHLSGYYEADVRDDDEIHDHILMMADAPSSRIIKQSHRFRQRRADPALPEVACIACGLRVAHMRPWVHSSRRSCSPRSQPCRHRSPGRTHIALSRVALINCSALQGHSRPTPLTETRYRLTGSRSLTSRKPSTASPSRWTDGERRRRLVR